MKRAIALAATGALAAGLALVPAGAASAVPVPAQRAEVVTTFADGSIATLSRHFVDQGALTVRVRDRQRRSTDNGQQITVIRVRRGFNIRQVQRAINLQLNQNASPAQAALSTRLINREAVAYGGIDSLSHDNEAISDTINLDRAGRYWVINTANGRAQNLGSFFAGFNTAAEPRNVSAPSANLIAGFGGIDRFFGANGVLPRRGTLRVQNLGDTVHVIEIYKVANGTTDAQVQAEFNTILANRIPVTDPAGLNSTPTDLIGVDALSPVHVDKLRYNLRQGGEYLVLCFVADETTGVPHGFMGMHKILHFA